MIRDDIVESVIVVFFCLYYYLYFTTCNSSLLGRRKNRTQVILYMLGFEIMEISFWNLLNIEKEIGFEKKIINRLFTFSKFFKNIIVENTICKD